MKKIYLIALLSCFVGQYANSQSTPEAAVQSYFTVLQGESNFKEADLNQWQITDVVPSLNPDVQHVYVQQLYNNIPIEFAS